MKLNCSNCFSKRGCSIAIEDPYAGIYACALRRCCEESFHTGLAPYSCLPDPIQECQALQVIGLEGYAPSDNWGFFDGDPFDMEAPIKKEYLAEADPLVIEPISIGDGFTIITMTRDTSEICPFWLDCSADCTGVRIPNDERCRLLGRHPLLIPIPGDDVAVEVRWVPGGPTFDLIDMRPRVAA